MAKTLRDIATEGDRAATLRALRDRLAQELDVAVEPSHIAALSLRLERVLAQIDDLPGKAGEEPDDEAERPTVVDEIKARREAKKRA